MISSIKDTEKQNPRSTKVDQLNTMEILELINSEDRQVAVAVKQALPEITEFVNLVVKSFKNGGRLVYVGAGTSGRLGVLDASECPPTFSVDPGMVQGIIAGGPDALVRSIEGAEDHAEDGAEAVNQFGICKNDTVLGIATSGSTPYVLGAVTEAGKMGASTGILVCNKPETTLPADIEIVVLTGPEIITGSTRMKAGTATKLVLNMITTTAMIKLNKTYGNLMIDLKALNVKLWDRGTRLVQQFCELDYETSRQLLNSAEGEVKTAIVMHFEHCRLSRARQMLLKSDGALREIIG